MLKYIIISHVVLTFVECHFIVSWLDSYLGLLQGQNGSHFERRTFPPPLPNKCDWEIEPAELDFSDSVRISKVWVHLYNIVFIAKNSRN